jgi:hypothetical protein
MMVVFVSKQFETHRCNQRPADTAAHWFTSVAPALRMYPQIANTIEGAADHTHVFYCPGCGTIALAPGKAP